MFPWCCLIGFTKCSKKGAHHDWSDSVQFYLMKHAIDDSCLFYTAISRKVVGKNVHATIPKGNMGYDKYTVPNHCSCQTYFCCFPLALANICPWPLVPFFQISLENRADKTTHNTFRDCRVHFFRQPFSKQLYIKARSRRQQNKHTSHETF